MTTPGSALEVRGLKKSFNGFKAVNGVDFSVESGSISAIIGPNGAGKTTLFNLITGHVPLDEGRVRFFGRDVTATAPHKLCRLGVGRSFQRTNVFRKLSVFENVQAAFISHRGLAWEFLRRSKGLFVAETEAVLASVGLSEKGALLAGTLSHGDQKQLELGITLALEPRMLLLDEPTAGMSATETRLCMELIRRIARERSLTLLFTEHDMEFVFGIADRILVLHQGSLLADGAPEEIRAAPEVRRVYLGEFR
jgi:branched-chain amino acid transport system ATP-binding protein